MTSGFGFEYNRQTFNQLGNQFSRGQFTQSPLLPPCNRSNQSTERYAFWRRLAR